MPIYSMNNASMNNKNVVNNVDIFNDIIYKLLTTHNH